MCTFVGVDSWGVSIGVFSVGSAAASDDSVALFGSSSSSSSTETVRTVPSTHRKL